VKTGATTTRGDVSTASLAP